MAVKEWPKVVETWSRDLRQAIANSGMTPGAIAAAAGIERSVLKRFIDGAGIGLATAGKIGQVVGVSLVKDRK